MKGSIKAVLAEISLLTEIWSRFIGASLIDDARRVPEVGVGCPGGQDQREDGTIRKINLHYGLNY